MFAPGASPLEEALLASMDIKEEMDLTKAEAEVEMEEETMAISEPEVVFRNGSLNWRN